RAQSEDTWRKECYLVRAVVARPLPDRTRLEERMHRSRLDRRILLAAFALASAALLTGVALGAGKRRRSAVPAPAPGASPLPAAPAQPGPPRWRSERLLWRTEVSRDQGMEGRVQDMQLDGNRLYYVGEGEVGCVAA